MIKAEFINPNYYYPSEHKVRAEEFQSLYNFVLETNSSEPNLKFIEQQKRICKFCSKKFPVVTFKKDAHLIPEFLGNRNLIHYSECDTCNELFSQYENDLANFFGLDLIINCVKGKKKKGGGRVPKFKDYNLTAEYSNNDSIDILEFTNLNYQNTKFETDIENSLFLINYTKKPYTPLFVYKAFIKIALGFMPEAEMIN